MRVKIKKSLNKRIEKKDLEKFTRRLYIHRQKDRLKDEEGLEMVNIYIVMKGYKIVIVDSGLTKKQRCTLVSLGFKSSNSLPTTWIYKAMDTPDLVEVTENLELSKCLKGVPYKIKN